MGNTASTEVSMSVDEVAESSDTMVEIKIKTLDSQTYTLQVNKRVPVPALKEQIAAVTGVLSEQQRLICRGKVLKDDELLSAYHVEDGHTLHLVVRQPIPSSASGDTVGPDGSFDYAAQNSPPSSNLNQSHHVARAIVFQAVNIGQGENTIPYLDRFFPSLFSSFAPGTVGTGNEMNLDHLTRTSAGPVPADSARALTPLLSALLDIGQQQAASQFPSAEPVPVDSARALPPRVSAMLEGGQQRSAFQFPSASTLGFQNPAEIPDSLTTINQYIALMRDLLRENFRDNGQQYSTGEEVSGMSVNESHGGGFQSHPAPGRSSLPNTAHLAEILRSTRQLLIEDAARCLAQLARQLDDQATVAEPLIRANIQISARRSAAILQNFGSLLLELGRTTMTLHMGQTPSEALVSAGPAIFISATGPNPLVVQHSLFHPVPTLGGVNMASVNSSHGFQGYAVPTSNANLGELAGRQRAQTDAVGNVPGSGFPAHAFPGAFGNVPHTGESGIRVVPVRRVVAIRAGDRIGVQLPVLARTQQTYPVQNAENTHASIEPRSGSYVVDPQPISGGNQLPTNALPVASHLGSSANESFQPQESARVFIGSRQGPPIGNSDENVQAHEGQQSWERHVPRLVRREEARRREELNGNDVGRQVPVTNNRDPRRRTVNGDAQGARQAIYFANMVRQLMPHISEDTTTESEDTATETSVSLADRIRSSSGTFFQNSTGASSSQQHRDPSDSPDPKRPKMDQ